MEGKILARGSQKIEGEGGERETYHFPAAAALCAIHTIEFKNIVHKF